MTMTNDRPDLSSEGAPVIDKTILINVNRNKYQVMRPSWALKPGLTDRLVVGRKVTLTLTLRRVEHKLSKYRASCLLIARCMLSIFLILKTEVVS
jgi:hypothetical protein